MCSPDLVNVQKGEGCRGRTELGFPPQTFGQV